MYTTLITAEALAARLGERNWRVFDCRFDLKAADAGAAEYAAGHIPGASYLHLDRDLSGVKSGRNGRHPLPDPAALARRLGELGVDAETQVVAYDAAAGLFAARAWWLLRGLGHRAVAVLDGGLPAWVAAGGELSRAAPAPRPRAFPWRGEPWPVVTAAEVAARTRAGCGVLLDVRASERFEGRVEPLDPVAGHVPGAVNLPHVRSLDATGHFRDPAALRTLFSGQPPLGAPQELVCMCGSGVTACHTLLALEVAGLGGARLYPGSWSEWCSDPARPVATGPA